MRPTVGSNFPTFDGGGPRFLTWAGAETKKTKTGCLGRKRSAGQLAALRKPKGDDFKHSSPPASGSAPPASGCETGLRLDGTVSFQIPSARLELRPFVAKQFLGQVQYRLMAKNPLRKSFNLCRRVSPCVPSERMTKVRKGPIQPRSPPNALHIPHFLFMSLLPKLLFH